MPVDNALPDRIPFRPMHRLFGIVNSVALAASISGCSAMSQDVLQYYHQMAQNYDEAAEKTKIQIVTLKSKARDQIKVGEIGKAKKIQHEIGKIEDWQIKCYRERDRFAKAAQDLEKKSKDKADASAEAADKDAPSELQLR